MFHVTLQDIGALFGGVGMLYGSIRGIPLLTAFADRVRVARERDLALERASQAEDAAKAFELAAKGWREALDQNTAEISELRSEVHRSSVQLSETMEELHRVKALLAQSIIYITGWHTFMRLGGTPPEMPAELKSEIDAIQNRENPPIH